jgi:hypothetical protein
MSTSRIEYAKWGKSPKGCQRMASVSKAWGIGVS